MKTVLITGASSGFGRATAELLAQDGHRLILLARRKERLNELQKILNTTVHTAAVDVTSDKQVKEFLANLPKDFKDIDVLINNAGMARGMGVAQEADIKDWQQMVQTNIIGLLNTTNPLLKQMTKRGSGQIINVGSVASHLAYKGGHVYGGTKAFVRQFSNNLRIDLFGTGIRVSNIEPGAANTEFSITRFGSKKAATDYYKGWQPLTAMDVARTIVWIMNQPPHVNVDNIEIMPLDQTSAGVALNKE